MNKQNGHEGAHQYETSHEANHETNHEANHEVNPATHIGINKPNKYDEEQQRLWQQLHDVLEQLKADLEATHVELAQGLQISRQPLVSFMQAPEKRNLPIHRVNLVKLWDFLTDPALLKHKKISETAKQKRLQLRQQGADRLLEAAGFCPSPQPPSSPLNRSSREQQIQRLTSMLASLPDIGFANFNSLINDLEAVVRSRAFPYVTLMAANQPIGLTHQSIAARIRFLFSEPLQSEILSPVVLNQIKKFWTVASASGDFELANAELFELSLCILNYEKLSKTFDRYIKIKVQQCQFTVLTFSLRDYLIGDRAGIQGDLRDAEFNVETALLETVLRLDDRLEDSLLEEIDSTERPSIVEAEITCIFPDIGEDIRWLYRSSATHLENMLTAMAIGMGCSERLELIESSTRTLGQKGYGLVKASAAFCDTENSTNIYESVWVDRSAIKAFLQSALTAATKWLSDELGNSGSDEESYGNYYKICHGVARIEQALAHGRKLLNDYAFQRKSDLGITENQSTQLYLNQKVIEKVQELQQNILSQNPVLQACYGAYLERQCCFANLTCARSAHVEGNLIQGWKYLEAVRVLLDENPDVQQCLEIKLLYETELMLHQFFAGDREFLLSKTWQSSLDFWLVRLSEYIAQENLKYGKYSGRYDFNTYLCASEIFGRITRLNLCFCSEQEIPILEESIQLSMQAAYCCSRIGYRQRAAHWLVNASRIHTRLGDRFGKAEALCNAAIRIIRGSLEPTYSDEYVGSIMAEVNLARGERLLLVEQDRSGAIICFLQSLKGAIYIGFARLIADGLYGIARAAKTLSNDPVGKSIEQAFNLEASKSDLFFLDEHRQGWDESDIAAQMIEFLNDLDKSQPWSAVADRFKERAQWIWQQWYEEIHPDQGGIHPVVELIEAEQYLSCVVPLNSTETESERNGLNLTPES